MHRPETKMVSVKYYLMRTKIKLDLSIKPEFDDWRWVSYWFPLLQVVSFKREVYRQALMEFAPIVMAIKQPLMVLDPLDQ